MFIKNKNKVLFKNRITLNRGFTLIELLVVIAIIGILGAIVYAPFQVARRKGRDAQKVVEMKNLVASINLYADSNEGEFPASLVDLAKYQTDPLPEKANTKKSTYDLTLYNYTPYYDNNDRVIGFHLYTHLETNNGALAGAAKCYGANAGTYNEKSCINVPAKGLAADQKTGIAGAVAEPEDGVGAYFTDRTKDNDKNCATNQAYCILDYRQ